MSRITSAGRKSMAFSSIIKITGRSPRRPLLLLALMMCVSLVLAGCAASPEDAGSAAGETNNASSQDAQGDAGDQGQGTPSGNTNNASSQDAQGNAGGQGQGNAAATGDAGSAVGNTDNAGGQEQGSPASSKMTVTSSGIENGVIADKYGMRGSQKNGSTPTLSIPLSIKNAPEGTVCYALRMTDPDSKPLSGFEWVHWIAVNIMTADLPENASFDMSADMAQGVNDFNAIGYGGPTPPDKPHTYVITVYALDAKTTLPNGFAKGDFDAAIDGHVLAEAQIEGAYKP